MILEKFRKNPEAADPSAKQEVDFAIEALDREEWDEVLHCLSQCKGGLSEGKATDEQKKYIAEQISKIREAQDRFPEHRTEDIENMLTGMESMLS